MEYPYGTKEDAVLFFIFIIVISFFVLAFCFNVVKPFMEERDYIKMEMRRSDEEEYYYWKKELRRLYLSHIPIIGRFYDD